AESIRKSAEIVESQLNIDLLDIMTNENCDVDIDNSIISLIPIAAFQIAMIDLFVELGIEADGYLGHSFGEFACGYLDGALTQEQYISAAIAVYKCTTYKGVSNGFMAVTDLSVEQLNESNFEDVYLACDNSKQSITVAGNKESIAQLIKKLNEENRFVRLVKTGGIAFHCPLAQMFFDSLCEQFSKIMSNTHKMSEKWISTAIKNFDKNQIHEELVSTYYCRCVSQPVYFKDAVNMIPEDAVVVEISARKFLASILTRSLPSNVTVLNIYNEPATEHGKIVDRLLDLFGTIYENGFNVNIENLYPKPKHPFDCEVRSISSLIRLDHSKSRLVRQYPDFFNTNSSDDIEIDFKDEKWSFLLSHKIGEHVVMPTSLYIFLMSEYFSKLFECNFKEVAFVFENITFHRNLIITEMKRITFRITFIETNGRTKVALEHDQNLIVTCFIHTVEEIDYLIDEKYKTISQQKLDISEVYERLASKGYRFGENFQQIVEISNDFRNAQVKWMQNFVTFIESIFQVMLLSQQNGTLLTVKNIECLKMDTKQLQESCLMHIHYDKYTKDIFACSQTDNVCLSIRNIHFESFGTKETLQSSNINRQVISKLPENEHYYVDYICLESKTLKDHNLIGVSGKCDGSKFVALIDSAENSEKFTIDAQLKWDIPEDWSLSEAAALPNAYCIAFYSLVIRGQLRRTENVFILNAFSPIGIAVITVCFTLDCNVFASVESDQQKEELISMFPQCVRENIYLSMNCETEQRVMRSTNGNGFDLMFSSTLDDSIEQHVNLIALNGRYLQLISSETHINSSLGLQIFLKNITFHGISISTLFFQNMNRNDSNLQLKQELHQFIDEGIKTGVIRPFPPSLFCTLHFTDVLHACHSKKKNFQFQ
ncbi:fatty acid synthase-like protein, partial [Leptotrombidium deliense]